MSESSNYPRTAAEYRAWWQATYPDVEYGFCVCGCGERTNISKRNCSTYGYVKGEPYPRLNNHHRRQSPHPYLEVDMGYETPCWIWQWSRINSGTKDRQYGKAAVEGGSYRPSHRVYYEQYNGPIRDGDSIHHVCCEQEGIGSTLCVNPAHLKAVTQAANVQTGQQSKLNATKVRRIRALYADGRYTITELGPMFGVNFRTISGVVKRRSWRNV